MTKTYKVHALDRSDQVVGIRTVQASSDEGAIEAAQQLERAGKCEVWQSGRHVATIDLSAKPLAGRWV